MSSWNLRLASCYRFHSTTPEINAQLNPIPAEFDIDKGNSLTAVYPTSFSFEQFEQTNVADLCLPDGAHIHTEDWTFIFLHSKNPTTPTHSSSATTTNITYGMSFFKKKADKTVRRGAIQKAVVVFSTIPAFAMYSPILRALVDQYLVRSFPNHQFNTKNVINLTNISFYYLIELNRMVKIQNL